MRKKLWRFSKKTTVWFYRLFEAFVAFFLVIFSLAFWKLYTEPMDAKFLLPTLSQELLPKNSGYSLEVESATLSAEFEVSELFHLDMRGLQLLRADKSVAINLPQVNLSYGFWHILTLNCMPDRLSIEKPDIHIVIDEEGNWRLQSTKDSQGVKGRTLPNLAKILDHVLSFNSISITDGLLMIEDLAKGENLSVPQFNLHLRRRYGFRHILRLTGVTQVADHLTDINARAEYNRLTKNLNVEAAVTPIYAAKFGRFLPLLEGIDVPVSVSVSADFNTRLFSKGVAAAVQKLKFQLKALTAGTVTMPAPIYAVYPLKSAVINGAASAGLKNVKIAESFVELNEGIGASLIVEAKGLDSYFKTHQLSDIQTTLNATVTNVPMAEVPKVWPKEQGTSAHEWVEAHLSQGRVSAADFKLVFKGSELKDVFGQVRVQDTKVDYLPQMPALEGVSAEVILLPNEVKINANSGHAQGVQLMNAALVFAPLDAPTTDLSILLDLKGPIAEMLQAINKKPLSLLEGVDFDWNQFQGQAQTRVQLYFPLDEETLAKELKVSVQATSEDAAVRLKSYPLALNDGNLELFVNNDALTLKGKVAFKDQPVHFLWYEDFSPSQGTSATYQVQGLLSSASLTELVPDIEAYTQGQIAFETTLKRVAPARLWEGDISLNLDEASAHLYPFSVVKKKDETAELVLTFSEVSPHFDRGFCAFDLNGQAQKKAMSIKGQVDWGAGWKIALNEVSAEGNNFNGFVEKKQETLTLNVKGDKWNLSQFKEMPLLQKESADAEKTVLPPHLLLEAQLNQLVLNPARPIKNVLINAERKNNVWKYFQVEALAKEPFVVVYNPQLRVFHGEFFDWGLLMSYLGLSDQFNGGVLRLESQQDDKGRIKGSIKVANPELREPSFLLQAFSILGIVDAIRGKNLAFDEIQVPFELVPEGELTIKDGYAAGSNLGVTFHGIANLDHVDIAGAVIPAYFVNSLPGKIPLIGALFREGEGGGLLSVKYSVKGRPSKPQVEFHPLSSMAPGALGYIF